MTQDILIAHILCLLGKYPYQFVSSHEDCDENKMALLCENQREYLINPSVQGRPTGGVKRYLLRKISALKHIHLPRWKSLLFTQHGPCPNRLKSKPYYGIERKSEQRGGRGGVDGNSRGFFTSISACTHSYIDKDKTKSAANRLKIMVSRKSVLRQQKTFYSNRLPRNRNHSPYPFTSGYSTLLLAVFLCILIIDTCNVFAMGKQF